jgi:hypothetical protein
VRISNSIFHDTDELDGLTDQPVDSGNELPGNVAQEALKQLEHEEEVRQDAAVEEAREKASVADARKRMKRETTGPALHPGYRARFHDFIESSKTKKTPRLIMQIWQSDYSIIAFVLVMASFYLMKYTGYAPVGVLFFLMAMATVDAILSIFVVRLSFHQNKHGFYRTEDFERDWLRYRMLLSMTKAALLFVVATSCGTSAVIGSYIVWFFTSTQRLRYLILRWSMDDHYPDLQRWSVFALLREVGVEPKLRNFNLFAAIGVVIGFAIAFILPGLMDKL